MIKLYKSLSDDIKCMRDDIKVLSELVSSTKKDMESEIKCIKNLGEREKNRFVRSHIPFRFIPEHTMAFHNFGI